MSRIGKKIINLDASVSASVDKKIVHIAGPKGKLDINLPEGIEVVVQNNQLEVKSKDDKMSSLHGLYRSLIQNAVLGVKTGWTKTLELVGVGFRAEIKDNKLTLHLGFAHPVIVDAPIEISFRISENKIEVAGVDKYLVGEVAAKIRKIKPPEVYKGKGIRYQGEHIRKKLGKAAKTVGGVGAK